MLIGTSPPVIRHPIQVGKGVLQALLAMDSSNTATVQSNPATTAGACQAEKQATPYQPLPKGLIRAPSEGADKRYGIPHSDCNCKANLCPEIMVTA